MSNRKGFRTLGLFFGLLLGITAEAAPIKPQPGEGKYAFCKRMFDACMDGVVGRPGTQIYNLGRAKCLRKWNSCRKTGTWSIARTEGIRIGPVPEVNGALD